MYKKLALCCATLLAAMITSAFAQLQTGSVKAWQLSGDVKRQNLQTGEITTLKRGEEFTQGSVVMTGPGAKALLLFSNGATINISENSSVDIQRFLQAPYDKAAKGQYLMLKEDPSTSDTLVRLNQGELVGKVKKLQSESFYDVETPIGSAGVRGTTFLVSFFRLKDGKYAMKIGNLDGRVLVSSKMPVTMTVNNNDMAEAEFDPTKTLSTGDVPVNSIVLLTAKPGDIKVVGEPPVMDKPTSYNQEVQKQEVLIKEARNPELATSTTTTPLPTTVAPQPEVIDPSPGTSSTLK